MLKLSENDYLELATKDINGQDLLKELSKKYPNAHPKVLIESLSELFEDKNYQKLVANLIVIKLQKIRSQTLRQIDELMDAGSDIDVLKVLDKLLAIVLKFSKLEDEDTQNKKHITIQYADGHEEDFKKENNNEVQK